MQTDKRFWLRVSIKKKHGLIRAHVFILLGALNRLIRCFFLCFFVFITKSSYAQSYPFDFYVTKVISSLRKDTTWRSPRGFYYQSRTKEIYICDTGNKRILIYDAEGSLVGAVKFYYGKQGEALTFEEPNAVVVDENDFLYIGDAKKILILDLRGNLVDEISAQRVGESEIYPRGLHLDNQGQLYFLSGTKVFVLDHNKDLKVKFTKEGSDEEKLKNPGDLTTDSSGRIYITDNLSRYGVNIFTHEGYFLHAFAEHGIGPDTIALPAGIFVDHKDRVWLVDTIRQHIIVYSSDGKFLTSVGEGGREVGNFLFPVDIAPVPGSGLIQFYVLEREGMRVQLFDVKETTETVATGPTEKKENKPVVKKELTTKEEKKKEKKKPVTVSKGLPKKAPVKKPEVFSQKKININKPPEKKKKIQSKKKQISKKTQRQKKVSYPEIKIQLFDLKVKEKKPGNPNPDKME